MRNSQRTGRNIRLFRHAREIHQRVLAMNTAIPIKVLQKIERGEMCATEDQLERISKEFNIPALGIQNFELDKAIVLFMHNYHMEQLKEYPAKDANS